MSKKILITITVILSLLFLSILAYYFLISGNTAPSQNGGNRIFRNFFSFNNSPNNNGETATTTQTDNTPGVTTPDTVFGQRLRKITSEQVSGVGSLDLKAGTVLRYIEKATGHIYEVELFSPRHSRISNTTIPVVYDAIWNKKATGLIASYLKDDNRTVDTYSLILKGTSSTTVDTVSGTIFPENTFGVSVFGDSMFYLVKADSGTTGYVSDINGDKSKIVWKSSLKEITPQFVNSKTIAINTNPYPNINGYLYLVDTTNGKVTRALGDILGLSTNVNQDASRILYINQATGISTNVFDSKTREISQIYPATFPEKCVWSKKDLSVVYCAAPEQTLSGNSLINWYLGAETYKDSIWRFETKTGAAMMISDLTAESMVDIDLIKPILSENEQYLVFINKKDNSLWSLDMLQPLNN